MHLLIVLVVALVVLGPKRLPGAGKALGHGLREFKDSISGISPAEEPAQIPAVASGPAEAPAPLAPAAVPAAVLAHDRTPVAAGEPA
jgi:sec-independent protein translocase protein TatA